MEVLYDDLRRQDRPLVDSRSTALDRVRQRRSDQMREGAGQDGGEDVESPLLDGRRARSATCGPRVAVFAIAGLLVVSALCAVLFVFLLHQKLRGSLAALSYIEAFAPLLALRLIVPITALFGRDLSKAILSNISGLLSAVLFVFVALKLDGTIQWSWWIVATPIAVSYLVSEVAESLGNSRNKKGVVSQESCSLVISLTIISLFVLCIVDGVLPKYIWWFAGFVIAALVIVGALALYGVAAVHAKFSRKLITIPGSFGA